METKLYPGIAFSPQATLTNNIGAVDTIIEVSDVSVFPPAPNLATIGTDEEGETILYTAKTATALSGCQRSVEGTARAWTKGELIGRNFTAKDHADLITAVGETRDAATTAQEAATEAGNSAKAAQDAAAAAEGKATAAAETAASAFSAAGTAQAAAEGVKEIAEDIRKRISNPNLLDNGHFVNSINQRGQTAYEEAGYAIDRWYNSDGSITLTNNGIINKKNRDAPWSNLYQKIEDTRIPEGSLITISCLINNNLYSASGIVNSSINLNAYVFEADRLRITWSNNMYWIGFIIISDREYTLQAVKLELGGIQTLAHKEGDEWALNEIPNYALELAKCQRYQQISTINSNNIYGRVEGGADRAIMVIQTPVTMRANGVITIPNIGLIGSGQHVLDLSVSTTFTAEPGGVRFVVTGDLSRIGPYNVVHGYMPQGYILNSNL